MPFLILVMRPEISIFYGDKRSRLLLLLCVPDFLLDYCFGRLRELLIISQWFMAFTVSIALLPNVYPSI